MLDPWFKKRHPLKHLKKWLYWLMAERRVLRDAKAVLFTCEEEQLLARRSFPLYRCNEIVVNFGTAEPGGDGAAQRELFLAGYPSLRGKRIVLFLGRVHEKKGCNELIEAWRRTASELGSVDPELRLVMAGPAESGYARELRKCSEDLGMREQIIWTGMLSGDLKWGAFRAAEAFILPSHQENFGIAVAEALACGVPVLISNKVNIWREIEEDGAGLIESDDVAGTHRLLKRWLALDGSEKESLRSAARRCFTARYEIGKAGRHLLEIFEKARKPRSTSADNLAQDD
jgi:glycosyltransferase involved in cell wall biosynthesis